MADNIDDLIGKIKSNTPQENKALAQDLQKNLTQSQTEVLGKLMANKELVQKLLSSDEAKNIMNKIGGDNNGHK